MRFLPLTALLLLACDDPTEDSGGNGTLGPSDSSNGDCSGTAPTIEDFTVSEGDPVTPEGSDTPQPTVLFSIEYDDEDGDAHVISMDMWYDSTIDGAVDTSEAAPQGFKDSALQDSDGNTVDACAGDGGTIMFALGVTGNDLDFSTEYEFGAILYDNAGMGSEIEIAVGTTPAPLVAEE